VRHQHLELNAIHFSTGLDESEFQKAERLLARNLEECRQATHYGVRPKRSFNKAAARYLRWNQHKDSIHDDAIHLKQMMPFIGHHDLDQVHMGTLQSFITARKEAGIKSKSINNALGVVRHLLNQAASEWLDDHGLTWLAIAPKIKLLKVTDARKPYPLSWQEQNRLIQALPDMNAEMVLFKVNTGSREQEVCQLQWDWEVKLPELNTNVFIVPGELVKNEEDRLIVLNKVAKSVIDRRRGIHKKHAFTYKGKPVTKMNNSAWKRSWREAGLPVDDKYLRGVHNLKHTFGLRLRAAGVPYETKQVLLGHKNGDITTHYSAAEIGELIDAAEKICGQSAHNMPTLTLLKRKTG